MEIVKFTVNDNYNGRLDQFVAQNCPQLSRSFGKKLILAGKVLIQGRKARPSSSLSPGQQITVTIPDPEPLEAISQDLPLEILFEDKDIIAINKPAGMVVHPAVGHHLGTLVNALLFHCRDLSGIGGKLRPGIVHRLDRETSGVILVSKNDPTHLRLSNLFSQRQIKKTYLCLVAGAVKDNQGEIISFFDRHPKERKLFSSRVEKGRQAHTLWQVKRRFAGVTELEVRPQTGRTHQIRVHCCEHLFPLLSDSLYGQRRLARFYRKKEFNGLKKTMERLALHALSIEFIHPGTEEPIKISAPLPQDYHDALEYLEKNFS